MPILLDLFLTFLKIGAVSFGGGYGMIPLVTQETISHNWLTSEQVMNFIAVSESTPGPIAVNMATFVGYSQAGFLGALLSTLGVVLPAFIIILIIAFVSKKVLKFAGVEAFLSGVRPVVIGLIIATGLLLVLSVISGIKAVGSTFNFDFRALIIFGLNVILYIIYKLKTKKTISPIILILFSAFLGIILYGFLGGI